MPAKLFNEPQQSERPQHKKTIKKIDDLILDAEIEAQAEINQKIRSNNTRMLLVVLVGVGLFYVLYSGVQNQTIPVPSFLMEDIQVSKLPPTAGPTPKPIPFSVTASAPATETSGSAQTNPAGEDLSPLENEALSIIQNKLKEPEGKNPETEPKPVEPSQHDSSKMEKPSPITSEIQTPVPVDPTKPALNPESRPKEEIKAQPITPQLTEAQSAFFIQVGAFSIKENADRVIKKLMSSGFSPLVQTRTTRSSMHVIFIGGFADRNSPQSMISELRNKGLNPILKKNDNGSYSIILGKERSKERAEALKQKLTKLGIFTSLKQMKINMRMFIVRVGGFENNSNALKGQKKIEHLGYMGTVIRKKS